MIAIDTSIWVDHFRSKNAVLVALLMGGNVLQHPFVTGELAMGSLRDWKNTIDDLNALPKMSVANDTDLYDFIETHQLSGSGVGFVDAHLMVAAQRADTKIWTRDVRMATHASKLGLVFVP